MGTEEELGIIPLVRLLITHIDVLYKYLIAHILYTLVFRTWMIYSLLFIYFQSKTKSRLNHKHSLEVLSYLIHRRKLWVNQFVHQLPVTLARQSIILTVNQTVNQTVSHTVNHSNSQSDSQSVRYWIICSSSYRHCFQFPFFTVFPLFKVGITLVSRQLY